MAKLRVLQIFADRNDGRIVYRPGQAISVDDPERVEDIVNRGLAEVISEKPAAQETAVDAPKPSRQTKKKAKPE